MIVTVFGASKIAEGEPEYERARAFGALLAGAGMSVCTGGYKGIMAAVSRGAKEAGGKVIGVTTSQFPGTINEWVEEERSVPTWQERLFKLIEVGDAFVVFDGGTGTLNELLVVWEMANKKMLTKPILVLGNIPKKLIETFEGEPLVLKNDYLKLIQSPEEAIEHLKAAKVSK